MQERNNSKQKILLLSSQGGNGHESIAKSLMNYFDDDYQFVKYNVTKDIIRPVDTIAKLNKNWSGEKVYNYFLRKNFIHLLNLYSRLGPIVFRLFAFKKLHEIFDKFIEQQKPDLIISLIPFFNVYILAAASKRNIPFVILTCDLDTQNYIKNMKKVAYKKFYYMLAVDDPQVKNIVKPIIPTNQLYYFGFPVRPEFLHQYNRDALRDKYHLPQNKPIIMLLMGGQGSNKLISFTSELAKLDIPIHILACTGHDEASKETIDALKFAKHITCTTIGYTEQMAELMAASDLLITKPGPNSLFEALYIDLPVLLDATSVAIYWEKMNITYTQKHQLGKVIHKLSETNKIVKSLLEQPSAIEHMRKNIKKQQLTAFLPKFKAFLQQII